MFNYFLVCFYLCGYFKYFELAFWSFEPDSKETSEITPKFSLFGVSV